jgi:hypothetical protein
MRGRILVTLLLACGMAQASDWVPIGKTDDGKTEILVDVSSIRVAGSIRRAWVKHVFMFHTVRGTGDNVNKWQSESVTRRAFNCNDESESLESLTVYYDDGTTRSVPSAELPGPWELVVPDTVRSNEMQFICAWKAQ